MARTDTRIRVGEFVYDSNSGDLARNGDSQRLRPQAARALAVLINNVGQVVTRDELQRAVWPDTTVEYDLSLNVCVRQIRAAFNDDADAPQYIETLPRRGYRLIASVSPIATPRETRHRGWVLGAFGVGAIAAAALFVGLTGHHNVRVAILPIDMIGIADSLEHIEYGVAEELISALANMDPERLSVIGKTSSFALAAQGLPPLTIGVQLDADYVLETSVRRVGNEYRTTIHLLATKSDTYAWSDVIALAPMELSTLDRVLAGRVQPALLERIGKGANQQRIVATNLTPATGEALLRSRVLLSKVTRADAQRATSILLSAIDHQPLNADLFVNLALGYLQLGALDDADRALARARSIDPSARNLDHLAGQVALFGRAQPTIALNHLQRAAAAEAGQADVHRTYAFALIATGDLARAVTHGERALRLDPVSSTARGDVGWIYYYAERYTDAERVCRSTMELAHQSMSARECIVLAAALAGHIENTVDIIPDLVQVLGATNTEMAAVTEGISGGDAASLWEWLTDDPLRFGQLSDLQQSRVLSMSGRLDEAIISLNRVASAGPTQTLFVNVDPALSPLRDLPEYRAAVNR